MKGMKARKYLRLLPVAMLVLALGACDNDNDDLVGNWKSRSDFDGYARNSAASFVLDGKGYICGGYKSTKPYRLGDLWEYNPVTNSWEQRADCPGALRNSAVGFAAGGKGYYGTGYNENDEYLKDFWEYDPATNTWTELAAEFPGSARHSALAFSLKGKGYVGTGYDDNYLKDFYCYDPATASWSQVTGYGGSKRYGGSVFTIGNTAYIVCGSNSQGYTRDLWAFDADKNTWTEKRKIADVSDENYDNDYNIVRSFGVAFSVGDHGYVTTGTNGTLRTDTWEYDPVTDLWEEKTSFEGLAREQAVSFSINGRGFVATGKSSSNRFDDLWEFLPNDEYDEYD